MAPGKYSRVDGKKSSCSTATIVVVVGVCLVGVWMFMSSSAAPGQNLDEPAVTQSNQKSSTKVSSQFEDNSGDLSDDSVKDESNQENTQNGGDTNSEESNTNEVETNTGDDSNSSEEKSNSGSNESEKPDANSEETNESEKTDSNETEKTEEKVEKDEEKKPEESSNDNKAEDLSAATQSEILKETNTQNGAFSTQAAESESEKKSQKPSLSKNQDYKWKTCNVTAGPDYIPCLDNLEAIRHLHGRSHYEHRERHCPTESPTCLVPLPEGYKTSIKWPRSREQVNSCLSIYDTSYLKNVI